MNKSTYFVIKNYLLSLSDLELEYFLNDILDLNSSDKVRTKSNMYNGLWDHYTGDEPLTHKWYYCDFGDYNNITFEADTNKEIINRVIDKTNLSDYIKVGYRPEVYHFIKCVNHFKRCI